ncbi:MULTISPECIES: RNA polymerase sigma factor SigJ [unclassified Beijerinckia]|uniref:RNA polymerase sigma factor SigJ n=1 Tax=unclassified Beijerinckia TaxID=2638183 RepID=UPI00089D64F4|nr:MULTISPECIES: RNA polymerase sigma factor SigJ [unclassified Beijerinckia]MDH7795639.1 RNA polymerase sigma-70 factor (ECF subfamily) [Beijerinckia sp. GAS462]SEC09830.1 RNA polymerase, sigma subunit, ECF family [Beijerinckia sp. 28-YEA-48]
MPDLVAIFAQYRSHVRGLAYRMLGTLTEAEDVVQDVFLRWLQSDVAEIRSPKAWLTSVTTRICIDRLRHLEVERAAYPGVWLPEPIVEPADRDVERRMDLSSDLSLAFMIVLERLSPDERTVFVLRDVFDAGFPEIAAILNKSEVACRQIASRARTKVREGRPKFQVTAHMQQSLVRRFLLAIEAGDKTALLSLLADDAVLKSDGGGKVRVSTAGIFGADKIVRLILSRGLIPRGSVTEETIVKRRLGVINGESGILTFLDDALIATLSFETRGERIKAIYQVYNPDKLSHVTLLDPPAPIA